VTAKVKLLERTVVQLLDRLEAGSVLPQESHQSQLTQYSHNIFRTRLMNNNTMAATTKDLNSTS
jgi:hypothetical protein